MEKGYTVKFIGCTEEQIRWGSHNDPAGKLKEGMEYIVSDVEVHSWHTKISLEGIDGQYNSVCFEEIKP